VTHVILLGTLVIYELRILFIQRKICQMSMLSIFARRRIVLINCEASKAFVVHINAPRVNTGHHNVNAQVELKTVYQKRIGDILADNAFLINRNF
jgi:hypothetical protein